ncbi:MAG: cysteine--tRNA ligase [Planctomycetota bacterium]|jgi:cysteinyl-tRNA synthetase|nr:cysteine--tRNA ligase [Planctomycetota bacterium]MDP7131941.1 cysteine--tRNA ligase [Planctomycetota bacterium]MDP7252910.1 cysteine--tRNA ligase [Planctomycetota bacterium]
MAIQFYNTLTNQKEDFESIEPGKVKMYNCGPTVYSFAHIGNFRAYVFADILRRYLEYKGLEVEQVMNITDVGHLTDDADEGEDKMVAAAGREGKDPWQIADFYSDAFFEDSERLKIQRAMVYPKATDHVEQMIRMIETLMEKGVAYTSNNCVYYDIGQFPEYGSLSGNSLEALQAGARIEVNPDKRNPLDFALWITDESHLMKWDSPWGIGYPGWHIECSAMSMSHLAESIDIHTGGEDNIFPHHECEIAQSEGATGKQFVKYWMHARYLLVDGGKMSKSKGNFYTLRDLLDKGYDAEAVRYELLSTHYRQQLNFTLNGIEAAGRSVTRLRDFLRSLDDASAPEDNPEVKPLTDKMLADFEAAMDDDLNISLALASIFDFVRDINRVEISPADASIVRDAIKKIDHVIAVIAVEEELLDEEIERLLEERVQARKDKNFARSDEIRDSLKDQGIILEDTPQGTRWKRG